MYIHMQSLDSFQSVVRCCVRKQLLHLQDELRLAVRDALCRSEKRKKEFKEAVFSLESTEGPIGRCNSLLDGESCYAVHPACL